MKKLLALAALAALSAQAHSYLGTSLDRSLVRLQATPAVKALLRAHDMDIAGVNIKNNTIEVLVNNEELALLGSVKSAVEFRLPSTLLRGPDPEYLTGAEVEARLKEFAAKYPDLSELKQVGESLEKRPIWALKISDNVHAHEAGEPVAFFNGMHHAREVMTPEVAMDIIDYLLSNYNSDEQARKWVDGLEIWVMPMFNVDGNNKVWTGDSMWRKNARDGYGVDINRNYPYAWNTCKGSSGSTWAQDYRGKSAGSEPETQVMMKFVSDIRPTASISYHSYSELVIYPYGCRPNRAETAAIVEGLGKEIAQKIGYTPGTSWETLYNVDGGDIDWYYHEMQVVPFVIEVSSDSEGFQPDYAQWRDKTVTRNRAGWQHLLNRLSGSGIRGVYSALGREDLKVEVKDQKGKVVQVYRVNSDGSYHVLLNPGLYTVNFLAGSTLLESNSVNIDKARVDLNKSL